MKYSIELRAINYSPEYDGAFKNGNIRGNATLFEFDSDNNLVSANYVSESDGYYNGWEDGWDTPQFIQEQQNSKYSIISSLLNQRDLFSPADSNSLVIGYDLSSVNTQNLFGVDFNYYNGDTTPNSDADSLQQFENQDLLISLTDSFWDNVVGITDAVPPSLDDYSISVDPSFNGKTINIDNLSGSNYSELVDQINEAINFNITSNLPLYSAEFARNIGFSANFRNWESGQTLYLASADTDQSSWGSQSSIGAIDVETDESGNHIETEFEFGVTNGWSAGYFLDNVSRAHEYAQAPQQLLESASGVDELSPNSTLRWDLDNISFEQRTQDGLPNVDKASILRESVSRDQGAYFYTSFRASRIAIHMRVLNLKFPTTSVVLLIFKI